MKPVNDEGAVIGRPVTRVDGFAKVAGATIYTGDVALPGMLVGRCLRSPYPSARIVSLDVSKAKTLPGVHAVLTGVDVPNTRLLILGDHLSTSGTWRLFMFDVPWQRPPLQPLDR